MPQYYLKFLGGAAKVDRYVAYTPLYKGTKLASADQLRDTRRRVRHVEAVPRLLRAVLRLLPAVHRRLRPMQKKLAEGGPAVPGVTYTTVITKYDELVVPYTSGLLDPPAKNFILQDVCPADLSEHGAVAFDPVTAQLTFNALDPANAKAIDCSELPPPGAPSSSASACASSAQPPHAYVTRRTLKATRRGLSISGQAYSRCSGGAGVTDQPVARVTLAIARIIGSRCAFLTAKGVFTRARSCRKPLGLRVKGAGSWSFATKARLAPGRYALYAYATGRDGKREAQPARPNARTRVA